FLTESDRPPPDGCSAFDSLLGASVRKRCAPLLDLPVDAEPEAYLERRTELGAEEANRRLLHAAALSALFVDTGLAGGELLDPGEVPRRGGAPAGEFVRREAVAGGVGGGGVAAEDFADALARELRDRTATAVAVKSVVAYRHGLDFDPRRPAPAE